MNSPTPADLVGYFIPKGNADELRTVTHRLAGRNREILNRARAEGRGHFTLWGTHQVHDDDGNLIGHQVYGERRPVERYDRAMLDGPRRSRVREHRGATCVTRERGSGHAPQEGTNARSRGSKRTTGSGTSSSGEDDPPGSRPCAGWAATSEHLVGAFRLILVQRFPCPRRIRKSRNGQWSARCPDCKYEHDRERNSRNQRAKRAKSTCETHGHTVPRGQCEDCGRYVLAPRSDWQPLRQRWDPPTLQRPESHEPENTPARTEFNGAGAELWAGMGSRAPSAEPGSPLIEAMRAAVDRGLRVELSRNGSGIVMSISSLAEVIPLPMTEPEALERAA